MSEKSRDVTREYRRAERAADAFNPGEQPDIAKLMRSAYTHGYAQALIDTSDYMPPLSAKERLDLKRGIRSSGSVGSANDGDADVP